MQAINEQTIREIAYFIWERAGRPWGQADRHWAMAEQLVAATPETPKRAPRKAAAPKAAVARKGRANAQQPAHMIN